jgi:4-amino-4-deoxy-L-arabinose transferase-like glycosyltransferase
MKKYILILIIILAFVLRTYKLGSNPPSLYWDEASLGYNAYSILKTAHDEHGQFLPITNFGAFGDYKPPLYIYATVPSIAILGLSEFAIRFPSAIFGILTVILTYFLAKKLFEDEKIALTAAFFLAISPWHLQFSRGAFEANLGLFFSVLGIYSFAKFATEKPKYIFLSAASFLAAMYTFTGQRLFVPVILIVLALQFRKEVIKNLKLVVLTAVISLVFFWPLFQFVTGTIEGKLRFNEVTIFKNLQPINDSIRLRSQDHFVWWANIIHNRRFFFTDQYLIHYFDAFNPGFLFSTGDVNPRLSIQTIGELYFFDLILVLSGIYFLFAKRQKYRFLMIGWLLVSPLGPAIARETPHALRMIHILPTFQLIAAYGIYNLYKIIKYKKTFILVSLLTILVSLIYYLHMYYVHYPIENSDQWQYGYKQAVEYVNPLYNNVDHVVVTENYGRPYIYFLLYMKADPKKYYQTATITRDNQFFYHVDSFDKLIFTESPSSYNLPGKTVFITTPGGLPASAFLLKTINRLDGKPVFDIGETINEK